MKVFSIDPSINSLGWACFDAKESTHANLFASGTIVAPKNNKSMLLVERIQWMICEVQIQLVRIQLDTICTSEFAIVIEQPESWGAYKSIASTHSGSLLGLHILVGALLGWGFGFTSNVVLIKVSAWKGQLPKHVTKERMEQKYNTSFKTYDEADAVGLGCWYIQSKLTGLYTPKVEIIDGTEVTGTEVL